MKFVCFWLLSVWQSLGPSMLLQMALFILFYVWVIFLCWRRQWHPTPVLLPGKSHGLRSLEGCSPWGYSGSDMTERLHFHFSLLCIGEGNGNPLQYSCLENPRDREAWWAAVYGVTQSRTRLKWLSKQASNIPLYICTTSSLSIPTDGHLGCFLALAIVK